MDVYIALAFSTLQKQLDLHLSLFEESIVENQSFHLIPAAIADGNIGDSGLSMLLEVDFNPQDLLIALVY